MKLREGACAVVGWGISKHPQADRVRMTRIFISEGAREHEKKN